MGYAKVENGRGFLKDKLRSLVNGSRLASHRTYIFPTGFGFAFGGISFVLLVMAIGYSNNLLYFFVFFLISMAMTGMWITNKNVDLFQIHQIQADYFFANEENKIGLLVSSRQPETQIWEIELGFTKDQKQGEPLMVEETQFEKKIFLSWKPPRRGYYPVPRIMIEGQFPFRMLRAWKYFEEKKSFYIFPERKGTDQIPTLSGDQAEHEAQTSDSDQGLFRDFREFQKSDPPQRIDWKRSLKHQKHLVKNFETSGEKKVLLDWEMTSFLNSFEDRISQMAHWIDLCHRRNENYALKIKDYDTGFGAQIAHYKTCMQRLAELKPEDVV